MAIDSQVDFHRWLFANLVKLLRCTKEPVEPVNSINKDLCGTKLLPMTVMAYLVNCACFCHIHKDTASLCVS